jgi:FkbM family methyltransferase
VGAEFHAFEPIPSTFGHLQANIEENQVAHNGSLWNNGLGDTRSTLKFTNHLDTVNHVASKGENGIEVEVLTLDEITFASKKRLVKIDVEGYEQFVLDGGQSFFKDSRAILGLIIELNGSGNRFGKSDLEIHKQLLSWGYASYAYDPIERRLKPVEVPLDHNTIYIPDVNLLDVKQRIASAPIRKIHGVSF